MFIQIRDKIRKLLLRVLTNKEGLLKTKVGSHTIYIDSQDHSQANLPLNKNSGSPEREAAFMKIIRQEVKPGMIVVDIGANIGDLSLVMAEIVGSSGKVFAIEPDHRNYGILTKNIEINGYAEFVHPCQFGISNANRVSRFYLSDKSNLHSMIHTKHSKSEIEIELVTIDKFMEDKGTPDFIKMDIEGHEVEALDGMYNTLKNANTPVKILMEVHPMYYSEDHSLEIQLRRLFELGFYTKYLVSTGVAQPDFFVKRGYKPAEIIQTDGWERGIYRNVPHEHVLASACHENTQYVKSRDLVANKIVRSIMIEGPVQSP